jgi:hypothetical protein
MEAHLRMRSRYNAMTNTLINLIHEPYNSTGSFLVTIFKDEVQKFRFDCMDEAEAYFEEQVNLSYSTI